MKLNELVAEVSNMTGLPQATIGETARSLQKAGLIKTGRPGRYGGAQMSSEDATALSIAVIATGEKREVTTAPAIVERFGSLRLTQTNLYGQSNHFPDDEATGREGNLRRYRHGKEEELTLFDEMEAMIRIPKPDWPKPFVLTSYAVTVSAPDEMAAVIFNSHNPEITNEPAFLTTRTTEKIFGRGEPMHFYAVRRSLAAGYFMHLHDCIFGRNQGGPEEVA